MDQSQANVDSRRAHERHALSVEVDVAFVRQSKAYPVAVGQNWRARTIDFSRGGACLATPWPLARGDTLELRITAQAEGGEARVIHKHAVVVNVRQDDDGGWTAGVRFISEADARADAEQPATNRSAGAQSGGKAQRDSSQNNERAAKSADADATDADQTDSGDNSN